MISLKRFFLTRRTVMALLILILMTVALGYVFPQRFSVSPEFLEQWEDAHPFLSPVMRYAGLDHVYSTPWFAAFLCLFMLSLSVSTYEQIRNALRKTLGSGVQSGGEGFNATGPEEELIDAIEKQGYSRTSGSGGSIRFVKYPWGYWGNVLLHLGILVAIASSLLIVLTQKRGLINLVEGEIAFPGSAWSAEDNGMLTGPLVLPRAVKLDSVTPSFWETDDLHDLASVLSLVDSRGRSSKYDLSISHKVNFGGLLMYQSRSFGRAFFVEFEDSANKKRGAVLQMENPVKKDRPSYRNFESEGIPYTIKAKYFADAGKRSLISSDPLLYIRLVDGGKVIGEGSLRAGQSAQIGDYRVTLAGTAPWTGVIFADITGMGGIFLGFFLIILGGGFTYFMPPREVCVRRDDDGFSVSWKATRFGNSYREEFERISQSLGGQRA